MRLLRATAVRVVLASFVASAIPAPAWAAGRTPVSNTPVTTSGPLRAKPNFMFILDDSGSMLLEYMPGDPDPFVGVPPYAADVVGAFSHRCNTIFWNPASAYPTPPQATYDRADPSNVFNAANFPPYPAPDFSAAPVDGFFDQAGVSARVVDLGRAFSLLGRKPEPAFYYRWSSQGAGSPGPSEEQCRLVEGKDALSGTAKDSAGATYTWSWTKVPLADATLAVSADEQRARFARWFSFYRTRLNVMKSAGGIAFAGAAVDDTLRIGFVTINPVDARRGTISDDRFLPVRDFDPGQKQAFLQAVYRQNPRPDNDTPLHEALSRVGRYFGGVRSGINAGMIDGPAFIPGVSRGAPSAKPDPVQYSCQRNVALLTTDGFWTASQPVPLPNEDATKGSVYSADSGAAVPRPFNDLYRHEMIGYSLRRSHSSRQENWDGVRLPARCPRETVAVRDVDGSLVQKPRWQEIWNVGSTYENFALHPTGYDDPYVAFGPFDRPLSLLDFAPYDAADGTIIRSGPGRFIKRFLRTPGSHAPGTAPDVPVADFDLLWDFQQGTRKTGRYFIGCSETT